MVHIDVLLLVMEPRQCPQHHLAKPNRPFAEQVDCLLSHPFPEYYNEEAIAQAELLSCANADPNTRVLTCSALSLSTRILYVSHPFAFNDKSLDSRTPFHLLKCNFMNLTCQFSFNYQPIGFDDHPVILTSTSSIE